MSALQLSSLPAGSWDLPPRGGGGVPQTLPTTRACPGACAGASGGALVAALVVTAPEKLEECEDFTFSFADAVRRQPLGAVTPGFDFMQKLREGIDGILPSDAHSRATDRLFVSLTHSKTGRNLLVSQFNSREELLKVRQMPSRP
uniref:PNPLA domain-containing protein n=1 Tax=Neogobius melanostomus TaxID=47308 RepID=A0A8C6TP08_9GOBI